MKANQTPLDTAGATVSTGSALETISTLNVQLPVFISGYSPPGMCAGKEGEGRAALDPLVRSVLAAYPVDRQTRDTPRPTALPGLITPFF